MKYYVPIKHPVTGDRVLAIPTGKIRQDESESTKTQAEVRIITPGSGIDTAWISRDDILET